MHWQPQPIDLPPRRSVLDRLSQQDIVAGTSSVQAERGERCWRDGQVIAFKVLDEDNTTAYIEARVQGRRRVRHNHRLTVEIFDGGGTELTITGDCSCLDAVNCEHVAAALFAAIAQRPGATPQFKAVPASEGSARQPDTPPDPALRKPVRAVLDPAFVSWLNMLALATQAETEEYPDDIEQRIVYVLTVRNTPVGEQHVVVEPTSARLVKGGGFSDKTDFYNAENVLKKNAARFLRPSDRRILRQLCGLRAAAPQTQAGVRLAGEEAPDLLEAMIATGRTHLESVAGPALTRGPSRPAKLTWRLDDDGTQVPHVVIEGAPEARVLGFTPPWYLDVATAVTGPLETGFAPRIATAMLAAPRIPANQGPLVRGAIADNLPDLAALAPPEIEPPQQVGGQPVPVLRLQFKPSKAFAPLAPPDPETMAGARLWFRYGDIEVDSRDDHPRPTFTRDRGVVEVTRDRNAEFSAIGLLTQLGLLYQYTYGLSDHHYLVPQGEGANWSDVLHLGVPKLRAAGWDVEIAADFPVRLVVPDGDIKAELHESADIDWFDLDLGVMVGGEWIDLVPAILTELKRPTSSAADQEHRPYYLQLGDGRTLAVPAARLRPIIATLYELYDAMGSGSGRFARREAAAIADLEASGFGWRGAERLREVGRLLRNTGSIPRAQVPPTFTATLRPYQARGVDWLQFLRSAGLGGVLADDMGLGKTVQTLAHLAIEKASGRMDRPALVVAPTSVLPNWQREAERFTPDLNVLILHGTDRKSRFAETAAHDLVLTTYPLLARDLAILKSQPWHVVVLDEAQTIKNPGAATTQVVFELQARHRLCLTGTPLENHLGEVWSLFTFLFPGFLGSREAFKRKWRTPIEQNGDADRRRLLARRVRPFLLRRTKSEVASDLPPKTEIIEQIEMGPAQREIYESIRLAVHAKVRDAIAAKGLARSHIEVLEALLKMRQACCHPRLLKLTGAAKAGAAKLERLMEMLPELIESGRRVLLFSQFTSMLALIQESLRTADIDHVLLTGDTRDRETPIKRFQTGEVPLFLISLKAGGVGLNLTAADTVIHYDPWWNPAVEDQATDRAHRIGQDKPVFVHKLVTVDSIEEKIEVLKTRKRELANALFDPDAGSALDLTEADIQELLALG